MPASVVEQHEAAARTTVNQLLASNSDAPSVKPRLTLVRGHDYSAILQCASRIDAGLIVLGITRHSAYELFYGTTTERVVRFGQFPVLLVKEPAVENYRRVLIATDGSPAARRAMACALEMAPDAEFFLLHAIHVPFKGLLGSGAKQSMHAEQVERSGQMLEDELRAQVAKLGIAPPNRTLLVEEGEIHDVIRDQIARLKPTLLALGTHGRVGLHHLLIGSVAGHMLSDPPVDVLVAKD